MIDENDNKLLNSFNIQKKISANNWYNKSLISDLNFNRKQIKYNWPIGLPLVQHLKGVGGCWEEVRRCCCCWCISAAAAAICKFCCIVKFTTGNWDKEFMSDNGVPLILLLTIVLWSFDGDSVCVTSMVLCNTMYSVHYLILNNTWLVVYTGQWVH